MCEHVPHTLSMSAQTHAGMGGFAAQEKRLLDEVE